MSQVASFASVTFIHQFDAVAVATGSSFLPGLRLRQPPPPSRGRRQGAAQTKAKTAQRRVACVGAQSGLSRCPRVVVVGAGAGAFGDALNM